jgi:signal transduction histidine kinase
MSHELRTPLNAILGRTELLRQEIYGQLVAKQADALRSIDASGHHLLALINEILDLAKIESGKLQLQIEPVAAAVVCQCSLQMVAESARTKRIALSLTLDPQVTTIRADERYLMQILINLLANAVKFTPEGGAVGLEVRGDQARQSVTFTVSDTGIGIAEADFPQLFHPFIQIDSGLNRQYAGTGLGLALVYRLAQAHQGGVAVESTLGQGSRFSVTLPWGPGPHTHQV